MSWVPVTEPGVDVGHERVRDVEGLSVGKTPGFSDRREA